MAPEASSPALASYLVAEGTALPQTVDGEETLPHSATQAWRNTHPDESLNLRGKRKGCKKKQAAYDAEKNFNTVGSIRETLLLLLEAKNAQPRYCKMKAEFVLLLETL